MELRGKVAVISGGASGLGRATALRFHKNGAKVAIFDLSEKNGNQLAAELGDRALYCKVNVADEASVEQALAEVIRRFGTVHICCNYAGTGNAFRTVGREGPFPLVEFSRVVEVNLIGTFNVLRLCAQQMASNEPDEPDGTRGVIINTASVAAFEGQIGQAAYAASKGGIVSMTLPIARDLASLGIRVNTIVPGLINTPMLTGGAELTAQLEEALKPLSSQVLFPKRLGMPDEIAALAQMLVEVEYLNGECIRCDGGLRMQPK